MPFYVLHLFRPALLASIRVNGHYKHQTPLTTTHKFENLHTLQRKLDARTLLPTVRPSSSPIVAKKSHFHTSPEAECSST